MILGTALSGKNKEIIVINNDYNSGDDEISVQTDVTNWNTLSTFCYGITQWDIMSLGTTPAWWTNNLLNLINWSIKQWK